MYDWVGCLDVVPLYFTLQRGKEIVKHSHPVTQDEILDISEKVSGCTLICKVNLQSAEIGKKLLSIDEMPCLL